jgi:hypothetical protein
MADLGNDKLVTGSETPEDVEGSKAFHDVEASEEDRVDIERVEKIYRYVKRAYPLAFLTLLQEN